MIHDKWLISTENKVKFNFCIQHRVRYRRNSSFDYLTQLGWPRDSLRLHRRLSWVNAPGLTTTLPLRFLSITLNSELYRKAELYKKMYIFNSDRITICKNHKLALILASKSFGDLLLQYQTPIKYTFRLE